MGQCLDGSKHLSLDDLTCADSNDSYVYENDSKTGEVE